MANRTCVVLGCARICWSVGAGIVGAAIVIIGGGLGDCYLSPRRND
jgi:hypothetical protein